MLLDRFQSVSAKYLVHWFGHQEGSVNAMLDQVIAWGGALKPLRAEQA